MRDQLCAKAQMDLRQAAWISMRFTAKAQIIHLRQAVWISMRFTRTNSRIFVGMNYDTWFVIAPTLHWHLKRRKNSIVRVQVSFLENRWKKWWNLFQRKEKRGQIQRQLVGDKKILLRENMLSTKVIMLVMRIRITRSPKAKRATWYDPYTVQYLK